jgi:hypothetical protein
MVNRNPTCVLPQINFLMAEDKTVPANRLSADFTTTKGTKSTKILRSRFRLKYLLYLLNRFKGSGFRVQGFKGSRVQGSRVQGFRGSRFRGSGFSAASGCERPVKSKKKH